MAWWNFFKKAEVKEEKRSEEVILSSEPVFDYNNELYMTVQNVSMYQGKREIVRIITKNGHRFIFDRKMASRMARAISRVNY